MPLRSLKVCQGEDDDKSYSSLVFLNLNSKLFRAGFVVECIFFMKGHAGNMDGVVRGGFMDHCLHLFVSLLNFSMISVITLVPFVLPSSSTWVLELWACATTPNLSLPFVTLSSGSDSPLQYCLLLSDVGKAQVLCRYANQFLYSWFL